MKPTLMPISKYTFYAHRDAGPSGTVPLAGGRSAGRRRGGSLRRVFVKGKRRCPI